MTGKYHVVSLALLACSLLIAPIAARAAQVGIFDGTDMQLNLCTSGDTRPGSCGGNSVLFDDGGSGQIQFGNLAIGNWNMNSGTASGSDGFLNLPNNLSITGTDATSVGGFGANALKLQLTIVGLTNGVPGTYAALNLINGVNTSGAPVTVTTQAWISTTDSAFCVTGCIAVTNLLSFTTNGASQSFSGTGTGTGPIPGPYSLTMVLTISALGSDNTSYPDALSQNVPEPSTLCMLAAGLLAVGAEARRRLRRG